MSMMLDLDSPAWGDLRHAYGEASDIPDLLRHLDALPSSERDAEPWLSLWSELAREGDVYSASFAAVPHVVRVLEKAPAQAPADFFHFPAWVEICRYRKNVAVPPELAGAYFAALKRLPAFVGAAAAREWDEEFLRVALSAVAVGKGFPVVAEAALELDSEAAAEFLIWLEEKEPGSTAL